MGNEGVINLLKPAGMTSHDAVFMLRRLTGIRRIGHTGTLDPMAVGVLPLCVGGAARITEYLDLDEKEYRCELLLGLKTDTLDIWGTVTEDLRSKTIAVSETEIMEAFSQLKGNIMQLPPQYSALKVNGKRLYEYARKGEKVEIKRRPVTISSLRVVEIDRNRGRVLFDVTCSKGTYIRSLCQEVGDALGCGATMSFLIRMGSGHFHLDNAFSMEELQESGGDWRQKLQSVDQGLSSLGKIALREGRGAWFSNGGYLVDYDVTVKKLPFSEELKKDEQAFISKVTHIGQGPKLLNAYRVYEKDRFLGIAVYCGEEKKYFCDKVFNQ